MFVIIISNSMYILQILLKERKITMKKTFVLIFVLTFVLVGLVGNPVNAQLGMEGSYTTYLDYLMLSDWQSEYLMPVEPAELQKGDYRVYGNAANFSINNSYTDIFNGGSSEESNASVMNYFVGFDTAFRDNLYFHIKYDIVPWQSPASDSKDQMNYRLLNTFIDYEFQPDKKFYFGYNHNSMGDKDYDSEIGEFQDETTNTINIYYVGFEIKGSFSK